MLDDDFVGELVAGIEGAQPAETTSDGSGKKERGKARFRAAERAAPLQPGSPKEKLISVLIGGHRPDPAQEAILNAIEAGFGITESDPMWIFLLPLLLKNGSAEAVSEVRELVANIKSAGLGKAGAGLEELSEAQRETAAAINAINLKLEKSIERAVSAALAKSEAGGGVDQTALARSVSDSIGARLMPARMGLVAGALAIVAALAFVAGVMVNKAGYDKYIAELEGKVQGYQSVLEQQKGAAK